MHLPEFRFLLAICFASISLPGFAALPQDKQTRYNLGFEYAKSDSVPTQWIAANPSVTGYSAYLDRRIKHSGRSSICVKWDTVALFNRGGFQQFLSGEEFAGKEVELSGWVKMQDFSENGVASIVLVEKTAAGKYKQQKDTLRVAAGTCDWTRISTKMQIDDSAKYVALIGGVAGRGTAWFDDFEVRVDGKKYGDRKIPAMKTELTDRDKRHLQKYVYPLRTAEPDENDTRDMEVFRQLTGDCRVVALGENTHGTSEVQRMKDRIIRYLAADKGFDIFAIEAGVLECDPVNDYATQGKGDAKQAVRSIALWPWLTEEMLSMVEWMRTYNASGRKMLYTGVDVQMYSSVMQQLVQSLDGCTTARTSAAALSDKMKRLRPRFWSIDIDLAKEIDTGLVELSSEKELAALPPQKLLLVNRYIAMLRRFLSQREDTDWRDRGMAENLQWIMQQHPESKILFWAHNDHVCAHYSTSQGRFPAGGFLKDRMGKDYISFGFASYTGGYTAGMGGGNLKTYTMPEPLPGTLEYLLGQIGEPIFILDLKKMRADDAPAMQWIDDLEYRTIGATPDIYYEKGVTNMFDYLIFIRDTSPTRMLIKQKEVPENP